DPTRRLSQRRTTADTYIVNRGGAGERFLSTRVQFRSINADVSGRGGSEDGDGGAASPLHQGRDALLVPRIRSAVQSTRAAALRLGRQGSRPAGEPVAVDRALSARRARAGAHGLA